MVDRVSVDKIAEFLSDDGGCASDGANAGSEQSSVWGEDDQETGRVSPGGEGVLMADPADSLLAEDQYLGEECMAASVGRAMHEEPGLAKETKKRRRKRTGAELLLEDARRFDERDGVVGGEGSSSCGDGGDDERPTKVRLIGDGPVEDGIHQSPCLVNLTKKRKRDIMDGAPVNKRGPGRPRKAPAVQEGGSAGSKRKYADEEGGDERGQWKRQTVTVGDSEKKKKRVGNNGCREGGDDWGDSDDNNGASGGAGGDEGPKCWLCTFSHHQAAKQITSFICNNISVIDTLHMASMVKEQVLEDFPYARGIRKRDVLRHIREHMLNPYVKLASILRSLVNLAESLRETVHQKDPETGDVLLDLKSADLFCKVLGQISSIYKLDQNKLLFGMNASAPPPAGMPPATMQGTSGTL